MTPTPAVNRANSVLGSLHLGITLTKKMKLKNSTKDISTVLSLSHFLHMLLWFAMQLPHGSGRT